MTVVLVNFDHNEMTRALLATAPGPADTLGGADMAKATTCAIDGCHRPIKTRDWCGAHYQRWHKTGDPLGIRPGRWDNYVRPTCSVDGCGEPAHAQGLCSVHAPRARRHGDPTAGRRLEATGTPEERYWSFVDRGAPDDCWPWNGGLYATGYGQFTINRRTDYAHRWGYEQFIGSIPPGLVIDHRCHNEDVSCPGGTACLHKRCQNPSHWEPVTNEVNLLRARRRSNEV